jgi:hypothetical protein
VHFYRMISARPDRLPMIVHCHAAGIEGETGASFVLLDDLPPTHQPALTRDQQLVAGENIPPDTVIEQVVDALTGFHAAWWEHPQLGRGAASAGPGHHDRAAWDRYMQRWGQAWSGLIAAEGTWFPHGARDLYDYAIAHIPRLWERILGPRFTERRAVTLTHGDAHAGHTSSTGSRRRCTRARATW